MSVLKTWKGIVTLLVLGGLLSTQVLSSSPAEGEPQAGQAGLANRFPQAKGGVDATGAYEPVADWPQKLHQGWTWGRVAGIFAETPDKIFIFQSGEYTELPAQDAEDDSVDSNGRWGHIPKRYRGFMLTGPRAGQDEQPRWEHCLIVVNRDGKLLEAWTQHDKLFTRPHKVKINPYDPQKHVWLVEDGSHQIFKFTNDGKLVQSWGESRVPGNDERHFNRPTDIAWLPDGTFFVSDGYTNTRVLKFDKDGKFLMTWGTRGTGPGQFNTPHSIAVGRDRRVYVADRSNHRIQIFDENGKYLDEWPNMPLAYTIHMTDDNHLWVGDGWMHKILKYDLNGQLLDYWGTFGNFPGGIWGPHQMSVDQEGNLYIAQVYNSRPSKFRPRPGANPARIMGREIGFGKS
jgi:hypothetical protein